MESLFADRAYKKSYSPAVQRCLPFQLIPSNRTHRTTPYNNHLTEQSNGTRNDVHHNLHPKLLPPLHPPRLPLRPPPSRLRQRAPHTPNLQHLLQSDAAHKPRNLEIQTPRRNLEPSRQGARRAFELLGSIPAVCGGGGMFDRLCLYLVIIGWVGLNEERQADNSGRLRETSPNCRPRT